MEKLKIAHGGGPQINAEPTDYNPRPVEPNLKGDWTNLSLLMLLYIMQSIPIGLSMAIPILLESNKNVTYNDQAIFSFSGYSYSLKILWAPIVDALYVQKFGRRKSWLVPVQYLIGMILIYVAWKIENLLPTNGKPDVVTLSVVFFSTSFLAATQDIIVDGWSLTMLKQNNVGYASICNSTGQAIGRLLGTTPLILLTSEDFCNKYLRMTPILGVGGIVTMKTLICGWGVMFITVTTLIAIFKKEKDCTLEDNHVKFNVLQSYSLLWYILKLPSVQLLAIIMLTVKIGFVPANDDLVSLKLIDGGISKDKITVVNSTLFIINILLPIAIAKLITGPKAMNVYLKTTVLRLPMNIAFALLVFYTSYLPKVDKAVQTPTQYHVVLVATFAMQNVLSYAMFVTVQSFFSQISDARFGGTYMTLLNTFHNLGNKWTSTAALSLLGLMTSKNCPNGSKYNDCSSTSDLKNTYDGFQRKFSVPVNGYNVLILSCTTVGIVWYFIFRKPVKSLQTKGPQHWLVDVKKPITTENVKSAYLLSD